jgi:hypothetical protein
MVATIALEQAVSRREDAILRAPTLRAIVTRWPAPLKKGAAALFLCAIVTEEFGQTEALLELNLVFHDVTPPTPSIVPYADLAELDG